MQDLSVTLVQTDLAWQDPAANRRRLSEIIDGLPGRGELIVLPEMFATGFTMEPAPHAEPMSGPTIAWMAELARRHDVTLTGSLAIRDGDAYRNRLIWMPPDGACQWYDKRHLFRMAGEHHRYAPGGARLIVGLAGWRICPLVCYDLRFPVWSRGVDAFDLQLYVANWPAARAARGAPSCRRAPWRTSATASV